MAVPVCARDTMDEIKSQVDELVCLDTPAEFAAVGQFYKEFGQVEDEEVIKILATRV